MSDNSSARFTLIQKYLSIEKSRQSEPLIMKRYGNIYAMELQLELNIT